MDDLLAIASINNTLITATALLLRARTEKKRSVWVRKILCKRRNEGACYQLVPQLVSDGPHYRNFFRLSMQDFAYIEKYIGRSGIVIKYCRIS